MCVRQREREKSERETEVFEPTYLETHFDELEHPSRVQYSTRQQRPSTESKDSRKEREREREREREEERVEKERQEE